jgi:hypothetical protein
VYTVRFTAENVIEVIMARSLILSHFLNLKTPTENFRLHLAIVNNQKGFCYIRRKKFTFKILLFGNHLNRKKMSKNH